VILDLGFWIKIHERRTLQRADQETGSPGDSAGEELPRGKTLDVISTQLLRSATSIGANYRAACRGKSTADVLSKLAIVEEETDETIYWLELLRDAGLVSEARVSELIQEANEITAMIVASIKTLRTRR
jgi:four helix bundle protein